MELKGQDLNGMRFRVESRVIFPILSLSYRLRRLDHEYEVSVISSCTSVGNFHTSWATSQVVISVNHPSLGQTYSGGCVLQHNNCLGGHQVNRIRHTSLQFGRSVCKRSITWLVMGTVCDITRNVKRWLGNIMEWIFYIWKAVVDLPCNLQRVIIILQRVVGYTVRPQRPSILITSSWQRLQHTRNGE